jgi:uncharacterized protein (TIGR02147 family)
MTSSQVSRVLNGKRNISPDLARIVADKIFLNENEKSFFVSLVTAAGSRNRSARQKAIEQLENRTEIRKLSGPVQLEIDKLKTISDWYHIAILDLTTLANFTPTPSSIASYLGISRMEAKLALDRLKKLALVEKDSSGNLRKTDRYTAITSGVPNSSIRKYHKQMLSKAIQAIDEQSIEDRYIVSKSMAISKDNLESYKNLVKKFKEELTRLVSQETDANSLYQVNVQLFEIGKGSKK